MIFRMTSSRFLPLLLSFYYFFYFYKYPQPVPVCLVAVFASGASMTKKKRACLFAKGHSFQNTIDSHTHLSQSGSVCYDMTKQRHGGESRCVCVARRASGILTQLSQKPPPAALRSGSEHPWRDFKREVCTGSDTEPLALDQESGK